MLEQELAMARIQKLKKLSGQTLARRLTLGVIGGKRDTEQAKHYKAYKEIKMRAQGKLLEENKILGKLKPPRTSEIKETLLHEANVGRATPYASYEEFLADPANDGENLKRAKKALSINNKRKVVRGATNLLIGGSVRVFSDEDVANMFSGIGSDDAVGDISNPATPPTSQAPINPNTPPISQTPTPLAPTQPITGSPPIGTPPLGSPTPSPDAGDFKLIADDEGLELNVDDMDPGKRQAGYMVQKLMRHYRGPDEGDILDNDLAARWFRDNSMKFWGEDGRVDSMLGLLKGKSLDPDKLTIKMYQNGAEWDDLAARWFRDNSMKFWGEDGRVDSMLGLLKGKSLDPDKLTIKMYQNGAEWVDDQGKVQGRVHFKLVDGKVVADEGVVLPKGDLETGMAGRDIDKGLRYFTPEQATGGGGPFTGGRDYIPKNGKWSTPYGTPLADTPDFKSELDKLFDYEEGFGDQEVDEFAGYDDPDSDSTRKPTRPTQKSLPANPLDGLRPSSYRASRMSRLSDWIQDYADEGRTTERNSFGSRALNRYLDDLEEKKQALIDAQTQANYGRQAGTMTVLDGPQQIQGMRYDNNQFGLGSRNANYNNVMATLQNDIASLEAKIAAEEAQWALRLGSKEDLGFPDGYLYKDPAEMARDLGISSIPDEFKPQIWENYMHKLSQMHAEQAFDTIPKNTATPREVARAWKNLSGEGFINTMFSGRSMVGAEAEIVKTIFFDMENMGAFDHISQYLEYDATGIKIDPKVLAKPEFRHAIRDFSAQFGTSGNTSMQEFLVRMKRQMLIDSTSASLGIR